MDRCFDYGIIGNCRSAALISKLGSIDWCCLPDFHSPSVFARLLDTERGGHFSIEVQDLLEVHQHYLDQSNILKTLFISRHGKLEVLDFFPCFYQGKVFFNPPEFIRLIRPLEGAPRLRLFFLPRLGYAEGPTRLSQTASSLNAECEVPQPMELFLYASLPPSPIAANEWFNLSQEEFAVVSAHPKTEPVNFEYVHLTFEQTQQFWQGRTSLLPRARLVPDLVERSALVLELLCYAQTGAIVAAATTSLPEIPGADRNWDYRYTWIRDASMTARTFLRLGLLDRVEDFLSFVLKIAAKSQEPLRVMYTVEGSLELTERELTWLEGNRGSRPVRIGNAAYTQQQNDIYGVLLDLIYHYLRHPSSIRNKNNKSNEQKALWKLVSRTARHVEQTWQQPDQGIWEFRHRQDHFVYSKLMSWVAVDSSAKIAQLLEFFDEAQEFAAVARSIQEEVLTRGWNPKVQAFTQAYESPHTDAANLLLAHYGLIEPTDPRYVSTVLKTQEELMQGSLMYRYKASDDFGQPKTSFTICTFWMIQSLALIGRWDEAQRLFENVLNHANHLGLLSEGIDFETGELVGNFPQAYSHLALIDTALLLSQGT